VRYVLLSVLMAAVALGAAAAGPPSLEQAREPLQLSELARYVAFKDPHAAKLQAALPGTWPFRPTASTGETFTINLSQQLFKTTDESVAQEWADFFGSLVHGAELPLLSAYILSSTEVENVCGREALACYGGNRLFTPAEDPSFNLSRESVAMHEYGHHVAYHRQNDPWRAIDYGPKRWASYEQVCAKTRKGRLHPGAENASHYQLNPGEAWAETYRVLNERHAGLVEAPWRVVTESLYPDARALAAAEQDVTTPWVKRTTSTFAGSLSARSKVRAFTVATPLDGRLGVTARLAKGERATVDVLSPQAAKLAHKTAKGAFATPASICGSRAVRVRVTRVSGSGPFTLSIARP
jgi:hypothetical protein